MSRKKFIFLAALICAGYSARGSVKLVRTAMPCLRQRRPWGGFANLVFLHEPFIAIVSAR
ncbi:MAG: hypothetical protein LBV65_04825 [Desulfovibrio sp.]|jgi:hypothetical protein|nr:hypothetical protein [Desulfovibrio sp.]